jgi:putative DNA primase/helicase
MKSEELPSPPEDAKEALNKAFESFYENGKRERKKAAEKRLNDGEEPEHLTDLGNAKRFARIHGTNVLYSRQRGKWILWTENGWNETGTISDLAMAVIRSIYNEAAEHPEKEMREALAAYAVKSESRGKIDAMLALAEMLPEIRTDLERFDRDPSLFGCASSVVDLVTGKHEPHWRNAYMTLKSPVEFDPDATCPRWERFLMEITDENADLAKFLQRSIGYSLTGSTKEQCFWLLSGNGSNGKTTFVETVLALMGEYGAQIKTDVLLDGRHEQRDYHLAELCGKRFVAACESNMGRRMAADLIKQATGGEQITARSPYGRPFSFYPTFKIWLSTNHRPKVTDPSDAMWRRIYTILFNVKFVKREEVPPAHPGPFVDQTLKTQLANELPGILNWAVEGCREWQRLGGLRPPKIVLDAVKQYREEEDIIGSFLRENYQENPDSYILAGELYKKYCEWCKENGEQPLTNATVGRALTERGFRGDTVRHEGTTQKIRWGLKE